MAHQYKWHAEQEIRNNKDLVLVPIINGKSVMWDALPKDKADPIIGKISAEIGVLKIELRKVQHAAFASEETNCFSADIYINGKKAGYAHNEGHGGPTTIEPHELSRRLDVYGATLPLKVSNIADKDDPTGFWRYQPDAESIIDDLLEDHLNAKEKDKQEKKFKRDLVERILFTKPGQKGIFQTKKSLPDHIQKWLRDPAIQTKLNADCILNLLPLAEARKVYDANVKTVYR